MHLRLSSELMSQTPAEAVQQIVLALIGHAQDGLDRLLAQADDEALHDFRVSIRRLRSTASAWRRELPATFSKKNRKALRKLQRMTGGARDAEVALAWLAQQERGDDRHEAGRAALQRHLAADAPKTGASDWRRLVAGFDKVCRRLRDGLAQDGPGEGSFSHVLARLVQGHHADFNRLLQRAFRTRDPEDGHRARVQGKRLRYLAEPAIDQSRNAKAIVKRCKRLQDVLGDMHDAHVLDAQIQQAKASVDADPERAGLEATRARAQAWHDELARDWVAWMNEGHGALSLAVDLFARELEKVPGRLEIERTYLLRELPPVPDSARTREIEQGYLRTPDEDTEERVRVIREGDEPRFVHTVKRGSGLVREEKERLIDAERFETLWPHTEGRRVRKRRHIVKDAGVTWEIDEFLDRDLVLAEVELRSADNDVRVPAWLAPFVERDVTDDVSYANAQLAK